MTGNEWHSGIQAAGPLNKAVNDACLLSRFCRWGRNFLPKGNRKTPKNALLPYYTRAYFMDPCNFYSRCVYHSSILETHKKMHLHQVISVLKLSQYNAQVSAPTISMPHIVFNEKPKIITNIQMDFKLGFNISSYWNKGG